MDKMTIQGYGASSGVAELPNMTWQKIASESLKLFVIGSGGLIRCGRFAKRVSTKSPLGQARYRRL